MEHIHGRNIMHRDLKAQNVFLMASDSSIRIGDFGLARTLADSAGTAGSLVGTPYCMAPEVREGKAYTNKADIWSMGILLYELCALEAPLKAADRPALPKQYSKAMNDLIESMLKVDASERPSVKDLLGNPTIKSRIERVSGEEEKKEEFFVRRSDQARSYSARSRQSNRGKVEEVKRPSPSPAVGLKAGGLGAGRPALKLAALPRRAKPRAQRRLEAKLLADAHDMPEGAATPRPRLRLPGRGQHLG
jgi:NIMA (never in mitosis gene a)-related kinase 1/4/5